MPDAAPAVAAPPAAAPPTPSGPAPTGSSTFNDAGAFGALDALAGGDETPPAKPAAQQRREPPKPAVKEGDGDPLDPQKSKAAEQLSEKDTSIPDKTQEKAPEKPGEDMPVEKMAPKQLREYASKMKARAAAVEKEYNEFKTKAAAPVEDTEKKNLAEKVTAAEKRIEELLEEVKFSNYEKHPDYAEQYEKPFLTAYNAGRERTARLKVVGADGNIRQGTQGDFDEIMKIGDDDMAAERATEMFGNKASLVLYHRERAHELNSARRQAVEDYRTKGSEREKVRAAETEKFQKQVGEEVTGLWKEHVTGAMEKYKQWSAPVEGDEKGNELLEKGYKLVNEAFADFNVMNPKLDKQQRAALVQKHAAVRNKAAWFDRLAYQHAAARKEIKALQAKLKEFEGSVPAGGDGKRGATGVVEANSGNALDLWLKNR